MTRIFSSAKTGSIVPTEESHETKPDTYRRQNKRQYSSDSSTGGVEIPETPGTDDECPENQDWETPEAIPPTSPVTSFLVDTPTCVKHMIDTIKSISPPALYVDLKGENLSRRGVICMLQLLVETKAGPRAWVVDIWVLNARAFDTPGDKHPFFTLKSILEDPGIPKLFWDCRMGSEALYWQYGILLPSVIDIQLMEVAKRRNEQSKRLVESYCTAVHNDLTLDPTEGGKMSKIQSEVQALVDPKRRGSWFYFKARPMTDRLRDYCVNNVKYLPLLYRRYVRDMSDQILLTSPQASKGSGLVLNKEELRIIEPLASNQYAAEQRMRIIIEESAARILQSHGPGWGEERDRMILSPWQDSHFD